MAEIIYPTVEKIIEYNFLALELIRVRKADKSEVLSKSKIIDAIRKCEETNGDVYDKAVVLLRELIRQHPFASGNRRTAFIVIKDFILTNAHKFGVKDDPNSARVMQGIRENHYSHDEMKEWLKHGKIREFTRQ
ncbi:Fic family protein [Candidatus Woesearchaeota archaeon]|nr:Fic family protein [Candidatus Woesearchaeota archaeon]